VGDLDGAEVDVFLLMGEGNSAGSESNDANDDEEYPDNGDWLHGSAAFPEQCDGMLIGGDLDALVGWVLPQLALQTGSVVICFYTGKEDGPAYEN
jgi:hypothetical protein